MAVSAAHKRASHSYNSSRDNIMIRPDVDRGAQIRAEAAESGLSLQNYILSCVDAAITGQPMQANGAPAQQDAQQPATIPPELMQRAQEAADKAGTTLTDWLTLAIDKRIDLDRRAALLLSTAQDAKARAAKGAPQELDIDALMANIKCHPDCKESPPAPPAPPAPPTT